MEDLGMDEDMYDDIWQRGKGIELDIKDVKAIKNGDPDGSDENDLTVDLKEAMGVKPHKKPRLDKPKRNRYCEKPNPEAKSRRAWCSGQVQPETGSHDSCGRG